MHASARILVAGRDAASRDELAALLKASGFTAVRCAEASASAEASAGADAGAESETGAEVEAGADPVAGAREPCDLAVLLLGQRGQEDADDRLLFSARGKIPVIAVVPREPALAADLALVKGADEVLCEPVTASDLAFRVRAQLGAWPRAEDILLGMLRPLSSSSGDAAEQIRQALQLASDVMGFERALLLLIGDLSDQVCIFCSTDEPFVSSSVPVVERRAYPEVDILRTGGAPVFSGDVTVDPRLGPGSEALAALDVRALAAFPIEWHGEVCAGLLFRSSQPVEWPRPAKWLSFGCIAAGILAQRIGGGQIAATIREQTQRVSRLRYETQRQMKAIEQLKAYFEASSDGIVVLDGQGTVLFVNRAAESMTGYARRGLIGTPLADLVSAEQRSTLIEVTSKVLEGVNLEAFDLNLRTTSGDSLCVSVATSTVLAEQGAAILMFRDVTAERLLEAELRSTKEFLEKLIDSAVDAIISADTRGNVIVFNRGAERILGWKAEEVIGRVSVERLYPEGVARQVMRML
ncbi:MAG: PAS domain S-box protein, partial [Pseudomonadota bacterium]